MWKIFSLIGSVLLLTACNLDKYTTDKGKYQVVKVKKSISIPLDFFPGRDVNSIKIDGKYFISIPEPTTDKKIYLFTFDGKPYDTIDISGLVNKLQNTQEKVALLSRDTIIFYTSKQIIFSNEKNKIFRIINVDSIFKDSPDKMGFFSQVLMDFNRPEASFIISGLDWYGDKKKGYKNESYYKIAYQKPNLIILYKNSWKTRLLSTYKLFQDKPYYAFDGFRGKVCKDGNLVVYSYMSDKIFFLDTVNFKVKKILHVKSDLTETFVPPLPYNFDGDINKYYLKYGQIFKILYNKQKKQYYVMVQHQLFDMSKENKERRKSSIIVYDQNLKKIKEIVTTRIKHFPIVSYVNKEGLWLLRNNKPYEEKKIYFDLVE